MRPQLRLQLGSWRTGPSCLHHRPRTSWSIAVHSSSPLLFSRDAETAPCACSPRQTPALRSTAGSARGEFSLPVVIHHCPQKDVPILAIIVHNSQFSGGKFASDGHGGLNEGHVTKELNPPNEIVGPRFLRFTDIRSSSSASGCHSTNLSAIFIGAGSPAPEALLEDSDMTVGVWNVRVNQVQCKVPSGLPCPDPSVDYRR